jgi:hypothetical protein
LPIAADPEVSNRYVPSAAMIGYTNIDLIPIQSSQL